MIQSLKIQNFFSHKKTKLEFSPGVNIICGGTDTGKSAILRALRWLVSNRPTGDSFRSTWGGDTKVTVKLTDGNTIVRKKTDTLNLYKLNDAEFKAFGTDVPSEIKKALNLNPGNIQSQFESHFLLSKSPGEVASHFNKVAHLDKIDVGFQNIQRWLKRIQQSIQASETQVENLAEELKDYADIEEIESKVVALELMQKTEDDLIGKSQQAKTTIKELTSCEEEIIKLEEIASAGVLIETILDLSKQKEMVSTSLSELVGVLKTLNQISDQEEEMEDLISLEKELDKIFKIDRKIGDIKISQLTNLITQIEENEKTQQEMKVRTERLEFDFHEQFGEGKECPLCETVL
jgi:exonuclease SbcC